MSFPGGVLLVIDRTGVPALVRGYGDVKKPASAANSVVGAIFYAGQHLERRCTLQELASSHRNIVYEASNELLLAFASSLASTKEMLRVVLRALQMVVGPDLALTDTGRLRTLISRHVKLIDYIVLSMTSDARLCLGAPVCRSATMWPPPVQTEQAVSVKYVAVVCDQIVVEEPVRSTEFQPSGIELALLFIACECHSIDAGNVPVYIGARVLYASSTPRFGDGDCCYALKISGVKDEDIRLETSKSSLGRAISLPTLATMRSVCCFIKFNGHGSGDVDRAYLISDVCEADGASDCNVAQSKLVAFVARLRESRSAPLDICDLFQVHESFTFVYCRRGVLDIYAACASEPTQAAVAEFGDSLATTMLLMH